MDVQNLPELGVPAAHGPRVVIAGCGFGGLKLARELRKSSFQVVIIDRNNYHMFQPLFYQVATSGLEPSAISFPLRKVFHHAGNVHIRSAEIMEMQPATKTVITSSGAISYDYLVLGMGAGSHFFGNQAIEARSVGMKSTSEALYLRNSILEMLENRVNGDTRKCTDVVVIGGGPTGVELAGSLAEMKRHVFPKDYPELDFSGMNIHLLQGTDRLLNTMSPASSAKAEEYLKKLGVLVHLNVLATGADDDFITLNNGQTLPYGLVIWAAGIRASGIAGIPAGSVARNGRIICDRFMAVKELKDVYCIGDQAWVEDPAWPEGHPQVAQPAIQQGTLLAANLLAGLKGKKIKPFTYKDLGSMATVGRNKAVVELPWLKFGGWTAWMVWMAVHLMSIVGVKNRLFIFINWLWNYLTYDQSLRLLIRPWKRREQQPL